MNNQALKIQLKHYANPIRPLAAAKMNSQSDQMVFLHLDKAKGVVFNMKKAMSFLLALVIMIALPILCAADGASGNPPDRTGYMVKYADGQREVLPFNESRSGVDIRQPEPGIGEVIGEAPDISPYWFDPPWQIVSNTTSIPYRKICFLKIEYNTGKDGYGTGVMVDSSGKVLTAAHNLHTTQAGWLLPLP